MALSTADRVDWSLTEANKSFNSPQYGCRKERRSILDIARCNACHLHLANDSPVCSKACDSSGDQ
eukprot:6122323-Lingulodinium_polyedra.AAC.1